MRWNERLITFYICLIGIAAPAFAQGGGAAATPSLPGPDDPLKIMTDRLDLEKYKATLKGLAQFGDRRQGTERNRKAIDWIEAQLKSYGCPTERVKYEYAPAPTNAQRGAAAEATETAAAAGRGQGQRGAATGQRGAGQRGGNAAEAQRGQAARGQGGVGRSAKTV